MNLHLMQNSFMNRDQVVALATVVDEGTVEGGAFVVGITPSAMSQRIRALESSLGQVLIRRTNPVTVTEAGEAVLKYAREIELLESETLDRLSSLDTDSTPEGRKGSGRPEPTVLRIGVNADSMATWFRPIFAEVAAWDDIVLRISLVDQDKSLGLLASGDVLGTITSAAKGGYGTQVLPLGTMTYTAVARRDLLERFGARFAGREGRSKSGRSVGSRSRGSAGRTAGRATGSPQFAEVDLASLPMVNFGRDDDLQIDFLRKSGVETHPPVSVVPSSAEFAVSVAAGLGWGMIPNIQLPELVAGTGVGMGMGTDPNGTPDGADLVPITAESTVDVPLYWHHWKLGSEKLERLTTALQKAANHMS